MPNQRADADRETPRQQETAAPFEIVRPVEQTAPVVFASPHSGNCYPARFVAEAALDETRLRRSEDAFVDEIFGAVPELGAPLLKAHFPRAYVDVNREPYELDPAMFDDPLPDYVTTASPRLTAGLGTIPKVVTNGARIYRRRLGFDDAKRRIDELHAPYHKALRDLMEATRTRFGVCLLVDCHSMPSAGGPLDPLPSRKRRDIVLGDCHGRACGGAVTELAHRTLTAMDFSVVRNKPYAGGYTTRHYGNPGDGVHVLQIEINRALYMDEERIRRGPGLPGLTRRMGRLAKVLCDIDPATLAPTGDGSLKAAE